MNRRRCNAEWPIWSNDTKNRCWRKRKIVSFALLNVMKWIDRHSMSWETSSIDNNEWSSSSSLGLAPRAIPIFRSRYKEECHMIASQSETKISELKQKIEHLRNRNDQLQSDMADLQRKDTEVTGWKHLFDWRRFVVSDESNLDEECQSNQNLRRAAEGCWRTSGWSLTKSERRATFCIEKNFRFLLEQVAKQLVRDRLAILPSDHYSSYAGIR